MNRAQALAEFARFGEHKDEAIGVIVSSTAAQVTSYTLTLNTVLEILNRCISGEIDLDELELWANVVESKSDIDYSAVEGVIYALSNSEQMGELDSGKVQRLVELLSS